MDNKKRPAPTSEHPSNPPFKHPRPSDQPPAPSSQGPEQQPSSPPPDDISDPIVHFQRAQLAAKIAELNRDLVIQRDKIAELQKLVAVLDAAPRAALYHMQAVREDLTLTLARLGWAGDVDPAKCPIAATLLDAEVVTNESLGEIPAALKNLTAQIIGAIEGTASLDRGAVLDELHRRVRDVSDQCERYAERDKKNLVESTTLKDEYDDLRHEVAQQRTKMVKLELQLRQKQDDLAALANASQDGVKVEESQAAAKTENSTREADPASSKAGGGALNGEMKEADELEAVRELGNKRLEELKGMHNENKRLISEVEAFRAEISRRDANVIPIKTILGTALYQTMEATLQQLYLKEKNWQAEMEKQNEDREAERKEAEEKLEEVKTTADKNIEDLRRQVDELRRIADAAKVEKDKVVMTYEARKMEAGNAHAVTVAAEQRAKVSEDMRKRLTKSNSDLAKEVEKLRTQMSELESQLKDNVRPDAEGQIDRLQKDLEEERRKSAGFIQEVESLSNMFAEVESENERLVRLLAEKEHILSRVMAERLRGRQLLTTIKEENKALTQGRDIDADKIKALTAAVSASKKAAAEATQAANKGQEEVRALASTLEKRRRIAEDATVMARTALAEKDEMKRERDAYSSRAEQAALDYSEDKFEAKRLREKLLAAEKKIEELEERQRERVENGRSNEVDSDTIRDQIIMQLRSKLNCSVVTTRPKEVVLLRCGHLFSRQCTDNLIATRNRKCPICGKAFGNDDVRNVFF